MAPVMPTEDEAIYGAYGDETAGIPESSSSANLNLQAVSYRPAAPRVSDAALGFVVREQAGDGNCLFRSISDQVYGTPEHHALLRDRCAQYISVERPYFERFVAEPFDDFLARIQRDGEWGDDVEIEALSEIYDCRVEIYGSYGHTLMRTFHEQCDAKRPNPIRLMYEGRAHYNSLAPRRSGLEPIASWAPGEVEDAAIMRSRQRREAAAATEASGREASAADVGGGGRQIDQEVLDAAIGRSRLEFEHRSDAEMDRALEASRSEWEQKERKRMDDEVVDAILQQSVLEEEQKQLAVALQRSKKAVVSREHRAEYGPYGLYRDDAPATPTNVPAASSSSAVEREVVEAGDFQYPESVYAVMSMGFPLEACAKAYHLVGDNPDAILQCCCQALTR